MGEINFGLKIKIMQGQKADLAWFLSEIYHSLLRCYGEDEVKTNRIGSTLVGVKTHNICFALEQKEEQYVLNEYFLKNKEE